MYKAKPNSKINKYTDNEDAEVRMNIYFAPIKLN